MRFSKTFTYIVTTGLTALAISAVNAADDSPNPEMQNKMEYWRSLEYGRKLVGFQKQSEFHDVEYEQLPSRVQASVQDDFSAYLKAPTHPLEVEDLKVRVYAAPEDTENEDLVELRWRFHNIGLRALHSMNGTRIEFESGQVREKIEGGVPAFVRGILQLKGTTHRDEEYEIKLPWPDTLENGDSISSYPERSLFRITVWHQRVDLFVEDGTVTLLLYDPAPSRRGWPDSSTWFPEEFERKIEQREAEK